MPSETLAIPGVFAGYRLETELGRGTFGVVYRGRDAKGREIAVKVLNAEAAEDDETRKRFEREARVSEAIDHPNVVRCYASGIAGGRPYLACEFVGGGSVAQLIAREKRLPYVRALDLAIGLMRGLEAIASRGLVHRDIKPANILVGSDGAAKISDLGLSRSTRVDRTQLTVEGAIVGSPAYIAPEQIEQGNQVDIRCDLYSAGILLFECLAGRMPFEAATVLAFLDQHLRAPVPDLRSFAPDIPAGMATLVGSLLRKKPCDRPASPSEALKTLLAMRDASLAATMQVPSAAYPNTLVEGAAYPMTMADGAAPAYPATMAEGGSPAYPNTMADAAAPAYPTTLGDAGSPAKQSGRREFSGPAPTKTAIPRTLPESAAKTSAPDPATIAASNAVLSQALPRAKITVESAARHRTWFCYAGDQLRCGRDSLERADQDICLRLFPTAEHVEAIKKISSQHFRFFIAQGKAWVEDLGSSGGTSLDGRRLQARSPSELHERSNVRLAGVLELSVRTISVNGAVLALVIERPGNHPEHVYALIADRLSFAIGSDGDLEPADDGACTLERRGVSLWMRATGVGDGSGVPLMSGLSMSVGAARLNIQSILATDQKSVT